MLRTKTLFVLLISSIALCNICVAYACTSYSNACYSNQKYEFRVVSVSTADSAKNSKYLKACIAGKEDIIWSIQNAYPGEVVYLRFDVKNTGNKPLKIDGLKISTTNNIAFNIATTYSKQTFNPAETIKAEVKLTITKATMNSLGLFTIKINVLGV
jgi:uncharacterized membrane protein